VGFGEGEGCDALVQEGAVDVDVGGDGPAGAVVDDGLAGDGEGGGSRRGGRLGALDWRSIHPHPQKHCDVERKMWHPRSTLLRVVELQMVIARCLWLINDFLNLQCSNSIRNAPRKRITDTIP
jgi:hypothetical protein